MHKDNVSLHTALSYNVLFPFWEESVCIISFEDLKYFHPISKYMKTIFANSRFRIISHYIGLNGSSKYIDFLATKINQGRVSHTQNIHLISLPLSLSSKPECIRLDIAVVQGDLLPVILI